MGYMKCYALYANDNQTQYHYVGATTRPLAERLCNHMTDRSNQAKSAWIESVKASGGRVQIVELSQHEDLESLAQAEHAWISLFLSQGHPLCNQHTAKAAGSGDWLKNMPGPMADALHVEQWRWQRLHLAPLFATPWSVSKWDVRPKNGRSKAQDVE